MTPEQMTAEKRTLIRGMNKTQIGYNWRRGHIGHIFKSNIAALHFDGQVLVDMVRAHREFVEKSSRVR